ncbi:MAG: hypothetical protein KKG00_03305, partial [Bacteroidetes bacterium]|nr:hypothetical protein [Bacteroidota bacterium]
MPSNHYEILLPTDEWVPLLQKNFYQATDGAAMPQGTLVRLQREEDFLRIEFCCQQDPYRAQTTLTEHNSDLWQ